MGRVLEDDRLSLEASVVARSAKRQLWPVKRCYDRVYGRRRHASHGQQPWAGAISALQKSNSWIGWRTFKDGCRMTAWAPSRSYKPGGPPASTSLIPLSYIAEIFALRPTLKASAQRGLRSLSLQSTSRTLQSRADTGPKNSKRTWWSGTPRDWSERRTLCMNGFGPRK